MDKKNFQICILRYCILEIYDTKESISKSQNLNSSTKITLKNYKHQNKRKFEILINPDITHVIFIVDKF